ncbi:hypothetical protein TUM17379_09470 [Shewanella algae]|uniref:HTH tetR-type domain-containing protein n=1 Tax=Shewanella algae TaxID=38313 RepID=A0AAD1K707_9GAMM|nr:hypothetical protein TUM17379_09470 [Shewanella algae]
MLEYLIMNKPEHNSIREAILDLAESVIAKEGILSLKVSDITKGLGISTTLFYSIFKTKEDILVALTCRAFDQVLGLRWWLNLESYSGLEKFIAYILNEIQFTETYSLRSSISTISCNRLIFNKASATYLRNLNRLAMEYWETPIQLLSQAKEQQEIQANEVQIQQFCHLLCTYLRGRELVGNTYAGKEYSQDVRFDNARLLTQLLKELCPGKRLNPKTLARAQQLRRELPGHRVQRQQQTNS